MYKNILPKTSNKSIASVLQNKSLQIVAILL